MKRSNLLLLLLLVFLGLLHGCRLVEEPVPDPVLPDPVSDVHGFAIVGKVRSNMRASTASGTVTNPYSGTEVRSFILDGDIALKFWSSYSSSGGTSYSSSRHLTGTAGNVEFVGEVVADSFMVCYEVNADTTDGAITRYNALSGRSCSGQAYLENTTTKTRPTSLPYGTRIDEHSNWVVDVVQLYGNSFEMRIPAGQGYPETTNRYSHLFWPEEASYLGFRWRSGGGWKYGYLEFGFRSQTVYFERLVREL